MMAALRRRLASAGALGPSRFDSVSGVQMSQGELLIPEPEVNEGVLTQYAGWGDGRGRNLSRPRLFCWVFAARLFLIPSSRPPLEKVSLLLII